LNLLAQDERFLASGDEAGTAPGDRHFRPDVEGLRAVAVLLVVFYHAGVPRVTGGFIGVDVFFVVSGFVITGLLLRERQGTGRTSLIDFYARRLRRIVPAATLVIFAAVIASYVALGFVAGNSVADAGRWAAVFLSNFHFEAIGTNYFTAKLPPSPLQNFWSLSVEEQFYLVYPTLFVVVASVRTRLSFEAKMAITLIAVIAGSFWLSVTQTASEPTAAYFSPFTRAWELALGALVAVGTPWLRRLPTAMAAVFAWSGLVAILAAAVTFTSATPYPGSLVAIPVVGAAFVIAGGIVVPRRGAERLLRLKPFQWFGKRSYSLYLWHWPILVIAAEHAGRASLPFRNTVWLVLLAIGISMVSYRLVENPIRHWRLPPRRTVTAGVATVLATVLALSLVIGLESTPDAATSQAVALDTGVVLREVAAAPSISTVPSTIVPSLTEAASDYGGLDQPAGCSPGPPESIQNLEKECMLGDVRGRRLLVVYGDSHADMWLPAFNGLAKEAHMRLLVLGMPDCPASLVTVANQPSVGSPAGAYRACDEWHTWAVKTINRLSPSMLVVSQDSTYSSPGPKYLTPSQWTAGLTALFKAIRNPRVEKIYLGNIPLFPQSPPTCLGAHVDQVQACSIPVSEAYRAFDKDEYAVTQSLHLRYIDPTPWFCSSVCTAIVGRYGVYMDRFHVSATYATYLQKPLAHALFGPEAVVTHFQTDTTPEMVTPSYGATLSGDYWLTANGAIGTSAIAKVVFQLSAPGRPSQSICAGTATIVGWVCQWDTSSVPNGHYDLRSVAYDAAGHSARSRPVPVSVRN
jgi:peptidoglycan/LPS O-acetylase OafA/YrhL